MSVTYAVPAPVAEHQNQCLLLDGIYYWAHPEVARTLAAYFQPNGKLSEGYTVLDFDAYVADMRASNRLQRMNF